MGDFEAEWYGALIRKLKMFLENQISEYIEYHAFSLRETQVSLEVDISVKSVALVKKSKILSRSLFLVLADCGS